MRPINNNTAELVWATISQDAKLVTLCTRCATLFLVVVGMAFACVAANLALLMDWRDLGKHDEFVFRDAFEYACAAHIATNAVFAIVVWTFACRPQVLVPLYASAWQSAGAWLVAYDCVCMLLFAGSMCVIDGKVSPMTSAILSVEMFKFTAASCRVIFCMMSRTPTSPATVTLLPPLLEEIEN